MLTTHNKMLEAQIAQQASSSSTPLSRLPSKHEPNPREQWNAMILRGGKQLERLKGDNNDDSLHDDNVGKEVSTGFKKVIVDDMQ